MDPSGQEANPYSYAACNPINALDPSGTLSYCALAQWQAAGLALSAAVYGLGAALLAFIPEPFVTKAAASLATLGARIMGVYAAVAGIGALAVCSVNPEGQIPGTEWLQVPRIV